MTTAKRGGLGRGLAALIPTAPPPAPAPVAPLERPAPVASVEEASTPAAEPAAEVQRPEPVRPAAPRETADAVGVPGAQLREVAVDDVVPNPKQPRQVFDDEALDELTHSVREFGLLQPIVVRERTGSDGGPPYELIMGERRRGTGPGAGACCRGAASRTGPDGGST